MGSIVPLLIVLPAGWLAGMLINYFADVLPVYRRPARPICLSCKTTMSCLTYILIFRPCPACSAKRRVRTWIVLLVALACAGWMWYQTPGGLSFLAALTILVYLGIVTVIDIEHRVILHSISLAGCVVGLIYGTWLHGIWRTIAGGAVGFIVMLALYYLGFLFIRYQRRRQGLEQLEDALGFGDVNLSGVIGLLLGWPGITAGLVLAVLLAGGFSLVYLLVKLARREYHPDLAIPYGPFLAISAAWLLLF